MAKDSLVEGVRQFELKMLQGMYKEAAKIREERSLPAEMLQDSVTKAYEKNMNLGEYSVAADLAKLYGLPENQIKNAAVKSFQRKVCKIN